jgi:hypothetical protein
LGQINILKNQKKRKNLRAIPRRQEVEAAENGTHTNENGSGGVLPEAEVEEEGGGKNGRVEARVPQVVAGVLEKFHLFIFNY